MFTFKQFAVHQDQCAQKVSEMACIFGAWLSIPETASSALDIGSGTGLLSLMAAQRFQLPIDAIELETSCFEQGAANVAASPFHARIHCLQGDVRMYQPGKKYDAIFTNPPFFEGQLKAGTKERILARHADTLSLHDLLRCMQRLLSTSGRFSVLFPFSRKEELLSQCRLAGYKPLRTLTVRHSAHHAPTIWMAEFAANVTYTIDASLIVKADGTYTKEMHTLLESYYLYF